jgi:glycosyltransferase involved in cell wall biosynthesis
VLVILGEGPERKHIEETAASCGVSDRVMMPGFVSEERKFQYLRAADIFASTTMHEGFGLMFVEGMFCGLPVVTYDHGGHKDFLEHERSGFLVPLHDQEAFLEALRVLCRDERRRAEIARHNEAISRHFTIEACAARYEAVFQEMLGHARATAH